MSTDEFEQRAAARVGDLVADLDRDAFAASFTLFRVSARLLQDLETGVHRPNGLSTAGFRVLFTVWTHDELEPRRLAALAGVSRAAISGVLKTLERDGLVDRRRDQADGRLVTVRVTEAGEAVLRTTYQQQNRREGELFADLSTTELRAFTDLMRRLLTDPADSDP